VFFLRRLRSTVSITIGARTLHGVSLLSALKTNRMTGGITRPEVSQNSRKPCSQRRRGCISIRFRRRTKIGQAETTAALLVQQRQEMDIGKQMSVMTPSLHTILPWSSCPKRLFKEIFLIVFNRNRGMAFVERYVDNMEGVTGWDFGQW